VVKDCIDKLVGSNVAASIAYSWTLDGAKNPRTMMSTATMQRSIKASKLDHLVGLLDWGWKNCNKRVAAGECDWDVDSGGDSTVSCASTLLLSFVDSSGVVSSLALRGAEWTE
jgi:hypothetical protein